MSKSNLELAISHKNLIKSRTQNLSIANNKTIGIQSLYTQIHICQKGMILENKNKMVDLKPLNLGLKSVQAEYLVETDTNVNPNQQLKPAEFISICARLATLK